MDAIEFLESKGIYSLDTKKRYNEVIQWMEEYARLYKTDTTIHSTNNYEINYCDNTKCIEHDRISVEPIDLFQTRDF
jgi:hypothetical protein